jgi:hypothetical protein
MFAIPASVEVQTQDRPVVQMPKSGEELRDIRKQVQDAFRKKSD